MLFDELGEVVESGRCFGGVPGVSLKGDWGQGRGGGRKGRDVPMARVRKLKPRRTPR